MMERYITCETQNLCNVFTLRAVPGPHQSPAINVESLFCDQRPCHGGLDTLDTRDIWPDLHHPMLVTTPQSMVTQMCLRRQGLGCCHGQASCKTLKNEISKTFSTPPLLSSCPSFCDPGILLRHLLPDGHPRLSRGCLSMRQ